MFRLATAADYEFLPEIGLYELTFDKRPVKGVRCEDPAQGAELYNQARAQFKSALRARPVKKKQRRAISPDLNFNEVIQWAIEFGNTHQSQVVLALFHETNHDRYSKLALELMETNNGEDDLLNFALFLFDRRSLCDVSELTQITKRKDLKKG